MIRKKIKIIEVLLVFLLLFACENKDKVPFEPYGAEKINYEEIKNISKDGPSIEIEHEENVPPISNIPATKERGPARNNEQVQEIPTADLDIDPDYGGIPIVTKEAVRIRESESEANESK